MLSYAGMAAEVMEHLIDHAAHGYSQTNRAGDGTVEALTLSDGTKVRIHGGDYDCSEAVRMCYAAAGVLSWGYWDSYIWTGNELSVLKLHGFTEVGKSRPQRGDVLWRSGHTELYLGDGQCGGARSDERGGITGPAKGDQTGREVARGPYSPASWTKCLRCTAARRGKDMEMDFDHRHKNAMDGQANVRPLDQLDYTDVRVRKIYEAICGTRSSAAKDGTNGDQRTRMEYMDQRIREDHARLAAMDAKLDKIMKALS